MKIASALDTIFLRVAGKFTLIITNAEAAKIKQPAVIIFIGIHWGRMLLNKVILNSHPVRSRMLMINTIITDIQTAVCNERGNPNEYHGDFESWFLSLSIIENCSYSQSALLNKKEYLTSEN